MVLEKNNFIIDYDENLKYIPEIIKYLESKMRDIMNFFELYSFNTKIRIIIYKDLELYKEHIEQFFKYEDYMCADTNDGNINILSLEAAHETKTYSNITLTELKNIILHEFVHICHQEKQVQHFNEDVIWFWEALATNLGNPEKYEKIPIEANNNDINEFNCSANNYPIAFTIGKYMLENYSHDEILKYVKFPVNLLNNSQQILDSAREWSHCIKRK